MQKIFNPEFNYNTIDTFLAIESVLCDFYQLKGNIIYGTMFWQKTPNLPFWGWDDEEDDIIYELILEEQKQRASNGQVSYFQIFNNITFFDITMFVDYIIKCISRDDYSDSILKSIARNCIPRYAPISITEVKENIVVLGNYYWKFNLDDKGNWTLEKQFKIITPLGQSRNEFTPLGNIIAYYKEVERLNRDAQRPVNTFEEKEEETIVEEIVIQVENKQSKEIDENLTKRVWQEYNTLGEEVDRTSKGAVMKVLISSLGKDIKPPVVFDILKEVLVNK